jgi:hypothetical protein
MIKYPVNATPVIDACQPITFRDRHGAFPGGHGVHRRIFEVAPRRALRALDGGDNIDRSPWVPKGAAMATDDRIEAMR